MKLENIPEEYVNLEYLIIDIGEMDVDNNVVKNLKEQYNEIFKNRIDIRLTKISETKEVGLDERFNMLVYEVESTNAHNETFVNLCIAYSQREGTYNAYSDNDIGSLYKDIYAVLNNDKIKELEAVELSGTNFQIVENFLLELTDKENVEQVLQYNYFDIHGEASHTIITKSIVVYERDEQLYRFNLVANIDLSKG